MKKIILHSLFFFIFLVCTAYAEIAKELKVVGNVRISPETLVVFGDIKLNEDYKAQDINELSKRLYDSNFFSYIEISLNNGVLEIQVKENPIIKNLVLILFEFSLRINKIDCRYFEQINNIS